MAQGCSAYDASKKDYAAKATGTLDANMLVEQLRTKAYEAPTRGAYTGSGAATAQTPVEPKLVLPGNRSSEIIVGGGESGSAGMWGEGGYAGKKAEPAAPKETKPEPV